MNPLWSYRGDIIGGNDSMDRINAEVVDISVLDNYPNFVGISNYAAHLSYYLDIPLVSLYSNRSKHYFIYAYEHLLMRKIRWKEEGVVITSDFMSVPYSLYKDNRTILVFHDPKFIWKKWKPDGIKYRGLYMLMSSSIEHMKKVFVSKYVKNEYGLEGTVIYPFVHKSFFLKRQMLREECGIIDAGNYQNKDVPYHESVVKNNDIRFIKFGAPMVHDNVEYVRGASFDTMSNYYSTAKFLLYLTKDEGFGYPLAQAMLSELPVVMRDIPINREVYGDSKYYDNDLIGDNFRINRELLEDIVHDKDTLMEKRKRALEMLDPEKLIARWKKVIEEAME